MLATAPQGRTIFDGLAWVGGQWQHTQCSEFPGEYRVRVGEGATYSVACPHGDITCLGDAPGDPVAETDLPGPAGILAYALRGVFCFHSSANLFSPGGVAFLGPSGRGKSTLAALLSENGRPRLADDILMLRLKVNDFLGATPPCRFAGVYLLDGEADTVRSVRLQGMDALRPLIEHSVGARLFGDDLLRAHFDFCVALCARIPVYRLRFPRRLDIAAAVEAAVNSDLRGVDLAD